MMDKKLIKALEPIEKKFDVELFTFDEALEFYKSDIESHKEVTEGLIKTITETLENGTLDEEYKKGVINGLIQSSNLVDLIFGGRLENGF